MGPQLTQEEGGNFETLKKTKKNPNSTNPSFPKHSVAPHLAKKEENPPPVSLPSHYITRLPSPSQQKEVVVLPLKK